jgi:hypothetical protein
MALSKANKAIFRAKYGDLVYDAMMNAENVIVTDNGEEKSLADVIASVLGNSAGYQTAGDVTAAINSKIASVYKPGGSCAFADLPALSADNEGFIYNVTDDFTTTDSFLEGKGKKFKAGADVGIVAVKDGDSVTYKYNVFANFVDLTGYVEKVSGATSGNLAGLDANGALTDSGVSGSAVSAHLSDTTKHITADERTAWNGSAHIYASATQPENLKNGDLWLQTFTEG